VRVLRFLERLGFRFGVPEVWSGWWVLMWFVTTLAWFGLAFVLPVSARGFAAWVAAFLALFLVPEIFSLSKKDDRYPPLTHTIRHYLPNWAAFPLVYGAVGAVGSRWLGLGSRDIAVVALTLAALGWLTDHFTMTYARPDPTGAAWGPPVPAPEAVPAVELATIEEPPVRNPRPV
jgi:hypothetical protein